MPTSFSIAAQPAMVTPTWNSVGPISDDGTQFIVGSTSKDCLVPKFLNWSQSYTNSINAILACSPNGHHLRPDGNSLSQHSNLLIVGVSDPGKNALVGFNDIAQGFDQQMIATDFEDLIQLCSVPNDDRVTLQLGVGFGWGEQAGHQSMLAALSKIQLVNRGRWADTSPVFVAIASNIGTLRLAERRKVCNQLKASLPSRSDIVSTLAIDDAMPDQAIRVTLLTRR